jgi:hypothetical protein
LLLIFHNGNRELQAGGSQQSDGAISFFNLFIYLNRDWDFIMRIVNSKPDEASEVTEQHKVDPDLALVPLIFLRWRFLYYYYYYLIISLFLFSLFFKTDKSRLGFHNRNRELQAGGSQ